MSLRKGLKGGRGGDINTNGALLEVLWENRDLGQVKGDIKTV